MNSSFTHHIISIHKDAGQKWLDSIPNIIETYEKKWQIKVLAPFHLNYNYVAPAVSPSGNQVVLKIGFPKDKEFVSEARALKFFNGVGAVQLLQEDIDSFVILLEKVIPGTSLKDVTNDKKATKIAAAIMQKLWKPIPKNHTFPTIADWGKGFEEYRQHHLHSGLIPKHFFETGEKLYFKLLESQDTPVLLHGDLHHENILNNSQRHPELVSGSSWVAIDPKGVVGEKAFEIGTFLRNPYPEFIEKNNVKEIIKQRIALFSDLLHLDQQRILHWALAQTILSAIWVVEDRQQYVDYYIQCAKILYSLL